MKHLGDMMKKIIKMIAAPFYHVIPNYYLYGKVYRSLYDELKRYENMPLSQKEILMVSKVKDILIYSYEQTAYYKELFDRIQFDPYVFDDLKQMAKIPITRRETVMERIDDLIAQKYQLRSKRMSKVTTAGTTGKQMTFYQEKRNTGLRSEAYFDYLFKKAGYNKNKKMAVIRNTVIANGRLWQRDRFKNKLYFNPFNLTDENIGKIIACLNKEQILFFHTYPSHAMTLSDYIRRTGNSLTYQPKAIFASSENLYQGQREFIEKYMGCKVYIHYGHSENGCVAGWCLNSDHYHVEEGFGYCEVISEGEPCKAGELGEIVTTGFNNKVMPLIRYGTEDYARISSSVSECSETHRCWDDVNGRWPREMLVTVNGSKIPMSAINVHSDIFDHVRAYQFVQEEKGICFLNIVKGEGYSEGDEEKLYHDIRPKLGDSSQMEFTIQYVEDVIRIPNGKYKYIIQKIKE